MLQNILVHDNIYDWTNKMEQKWFNKQPIIQPSPAIWCIMYKLIF